MRIENLSVKSKVKKGNIKLEKLAKKYGIIYVDIYDVFLDSTYLPVPTDPHPSNEGYKKISEIKSAIRPLIIKVAGA